MTVCKNCEGKYYTGKENTPLGRGYSASVEKVGKRMKGKDGNMYEVVKSGKGKRWMKVTPKRKTSSSPKRKTSSSPKRKTSPRMYDEKLWEYAEKIILLPVDEVVLWGKTYRIGERIDDRFVKGAYQYIDNICNLKANFIYVGATDSQIASGNTWDQALSLEWEKGKTPSNNPECRESVKVLGNLFQKYVAEDDILTANVIMSLRYEYTNRGVEHQRIDQKPMDESVFDRLYDDDDL